MGVPGFRLVTTWCADGRIRRARAAAVWPWVLARIKEGDGCASDDALAADICALDLWLPESVCAEQIEGLRRVGLLERRDGQWWTPGWHKYQPRSDAERKREQRARERAVAKVTPHPEVSRSVTPGHECHDGHECHHRREEIGTGREEKRESSTIVELPAPVGAGGVEIDPIAGQVREVYAYWCDRLGMSPGAMRRKMSTSSGRKRAGKVRTRLREGCSVDDLKRAIDGNAASRWHQGDNPNGVKYDDLELICRDSEKVREFVIKAGK